MSFILIAIADQSGRVVGGEVVRVNKSLQAFTEASREARKIKGEARAQEITREVADVILANMHVALMEERGMTFDDLLTLAASKIEN
jgi:hypothetical protein